MGEDVTEPGPGAGNAPAGASEHRLSPSGTPRYAPEWLELRERADATARAPGLLGRLREQLAGQPAGRPRRDGQLVIRDMGCGTGSMGRWLAGRLAGPQLWILHDRDPDLLARASADPPLAAADGSPVTVTTERGDIDGLTAKTLADTSLVTASALLDVLTHDEVHGLAAACAAAGCPALLSLSVVGRVDFTPADPLDAEITAAFNAHQRRGEPGRRLLGPHAVEAASEAFAQQGAAVRAEASPWRLGAAESALTAQWLQGWVGAACEERPDLAARTGPYLRRRLAQCAAGELRVVVHHSDLLALPRPQGPS